MDQHVTSAARDVLDEVDLDQSYVVKAKLALRIAQSIAEMGLSQRETATPMPINQPELSLLTRGRLDDISQVKLEECLRALGHDIEIGISQRHEGVGKIVVREVA